MYLVTAGKVQALNTRLLRLVHRALVKMSNLEPLGTKDEESVLLQADLDIVEQTRSSLAMPYVSKEEQ